jgi:hypothetical protein
MSKLKAGCAASCVNCVPASNAIATRRAVKQYNLAPKRFHSVLGRRRTVSKTSSKGSPSPRRVTREYFRPTSAGARLCIIITIVHYHDVREREQGAKGGI